MNGSWHRYRPGERWRRPPARARLVLEVPGAVAVCFDAPVVELLEQRAEALHAPLAGLGPDLLFARLRCRRGHPSSARPQPRASLDRQGADSTSARSPGSATSTRARSPSYRLCRRSPRFRRSMTRRGAPGGDGPATPARQRRRRTRPGTRDDDGQLGSARPAVRLWLVRTAVPALPDAHRPRPAGDGPAPADVLVPQAAIRGSDRAAYRPPPDV